MGISVNVRHKAPPRDHLLFGEHLTSANFDEPIRETYLGQAHIAGTGPEGKTCRECIFWCRKAYRKRPDGSYEEYTKAPSYFGKRNKTNPLGLKKAFCTRPILNKAKRLIPHSARSCRLFEPNPSPAPVVRPEP